MPDFLGKASCRGHRPQHLIARRHYPRPDLIAKLLRERHVARFVVAPDGFGKSGLAMEYAETVFRFKHVFWIDAKSPCFLRDLDDGIIASTLLEQDTMSFLVVVEDVPPLDPERVERFSDEMDRLLEHECEVLVTCVPACDAFARHRDRIKLGASDLLLTDAEVDALRTPSECSAQPAALMPPSRRIAGLVWGKPEERSSFLAAALREELPIDLLLPSFAMLSLQRGALADVAAFAPHAAESMDILAEQYPYLGIDRQRERFDTAPFSMDDIAFVLSGRLDALAGRSVFSDGDVLAVRIADALLAQGRHERACEAARLLAGRRARASWLAERGKDLAKAACLVPACEVYRSLNGEKGDLSFALDTGEAYRRALLGDREAACSAARRVVGDAAAPTALRTVGALVLATCADGAERQRAERLTASFSEVLERDASAGLTAPFVDARSLAAVAAVRVALERSCAEGAETWLSWYDRGARGEALSLSASWVLQRAESDPSVHAIERLAAIVRKRVGQVGCGSIGLLDAEAGVSFERARECGAVSLPSLDPSASLAVRRMEMALFTQRSDCERLERERADQRRLFVATHPDAFRADGPVPVSGSLMETEPTLTVNLFGGLDVRIGDRRVDPLQFNRQKVRTLLALLVLNRGREFSRDRLVGLLWPDSDLAMARKNFYGVWSQLRRALKTPVGTCPYLIRQQNGLHLDANLLASDVMQFDEVCKTLLFERPGYGGWAHLYTQINDRFSDDLLPSDNDNEAIAGMRADYRNRLVDALVAASTRLVDAGEVQEGLWFARAALQRDRTREDAYVTLMRSQLAAGQRTAALETYFACRRFLADELGIDPSIETMRLYHSIIETETLLD